MMLTIDAARRVTKTKENCDDIPKLESALESLFEIDGLDRHKLWNTWTETNEYRHRLKGYWINKWNCTDTHVGEMAYFLDDELVFTCELTARTGVTKIYFVDQNSYNKIKVYMDFFRIPAELCEPDFIGDQQTDERQTRKYSDSCLHRRGSYQNREVEIAHIPYEIRRELNLPGSDCNFFYALFPYVYVVEDGCKKPVHMSELSFGLNVDGN
ncbi:hypothetical protein [Pseudomonas serbica]|uniref:hypothetical protein n=1 Tax=Pseudomonas serbica TaxID=2965074 RepID=UPI00237C3CF6|nr:hypothetical protein [Pseudomonas serbica]